jgi:two-component system, OmpR family, response regulator
LFAKPTVSEYHIAVAHKILIVEDDRTLQDVLRFNFLKEGYVLSQAYTGPQALELARKERPDLIILDIMLPELSGTEVLRILRQKMNTPVIMLTAKSEEIDKVVGLEMGADDYVAKPFGMKELLARVKAQLRRGTVSTAPPSSAIKLGELEIDIPRHTVTRGGEAVNLTPKEFELLSFLSQNKGLVFSREQLLEKVWGYDYAGDTRTVDVHMRWLRQKLEDDPARPKFLLTVRGTGYKVEG